MTDITLEQRARELYIETLQSMLDQDYPKGAPDRLPQFSTERAALTAAIAALRLSAGADWVLVPREPTEVMRIAGALSTGGYIDDYRAMLAAAPCHEPGESCGWCHQCRPATITDQRMILCPDCGNKRCPKANDHRNACTNSNKTGQPGSAYP